MLLLLSSNVVLLALLLALLLVLLMVLLLMLLMVLLLMLLILLIPLVRIRTGAAGVLQVSALIEQCKYWGPSTLCCVRQPADCLHW